MVSHHQTRRVVVALSRDMGSRVTVVPLGAVEKASFLERLLGVPELSNALAVFVQVLEVEARELGPVVVAETALLSVKAPLEY